MNNIKSNLISNELRNALIANFQQADLRQDRNRRQAHRGTQGGGAQAEDH